MGYKVQFHFRRLNLSWKTGIKGSVSSKLVHWAQGSVSLRDSKSTSLQRGLKVLYYIQHILEYVGSVVALSQTYRVRIHILPERSMMRFTGQYSINTGTKREEQFLTEKQFLKEK